ncbi:MAG: CRISPR system precrRNA processing endoribonuclease RAMP protein Cas6 [Candidatus Zipacnadales bacterium]
MTAKRGQVSLRLCECLMRLRFTSSGRLSSHIGTTLRGGFGKALKEIACVYPQRTCRECSLNTRCAYGYLFETPIPAGVQIMRRYPHAPHPFVLCPPVDSPFAVDNGTSISLSLTLFGRAVDYFLHVLLGLLRLGELGLGVERVTFNVETIVPEPKGSVAYALQNGQPVPSPSLQSVDVSVGSASQGTFQVRLLTPLRLRVENKVLRHLEFASLVSAALRRLELLCRVHEAGTYELDSQGLVRLAASTSLVRDETHWHDLSRYSKRQEQRMPLGGIFGTATFEGDYGTLQELINLAGRVHVGKGTAFGHGRFQMEGESS